MGGGSPNGLRMAAAYGAEAVLHVPGGVRNVPMPESWEFDIEFDETNGHLTRVAKGDNEKYKAYIEAHNRSMDSSREYVKKLIPVAEGDQGDRRPGERVEQLLREAVDLQVDGGLVQEPLGQGLLRRRQSRQVPYAARSLDPRVRSPWWPRSTSRTSSSIRTTTAGISSIPATEASTGRLVRQAFDDVGYNGWLTIEDGGIPYPEFSKRMDLIIAGK